MIEWLHDLPLPLGALVVCIGFLVPTLIGSILFQPALARPLKGDSDGAAPRCELARFRAAPYDRVHVPQYPPAPQFRPTRHD